MTRQGRSKRIILGLTGSFGSGKTTVAKIFKSFGAQVIDADEIAHRIIQPRRQVYQKIISIFGENILGKNKLIDRDRLGQIVFSNKNLLKKLNRLMHPEIIRIIKRRIKTSQAKVIVLDAPLLIEAGLEDLADKLIVVKIDKDKQIERLSNKSRFKETEILKRIGAQIPLRDKLRLADFVIDNSGTIQNTKRQAGQIRRSLWKN